MSHYSYPKLCHITHTLNCVPVIAFPHSLYWIQFKVNYIVNNCEYAIQTNQLKGPISFRWNISFKTMVHLVKLPICNTCIFYCCMLDSLSIWIMLQLTTANLDIIWGSMAKINNFPFDFPTTSIWITYSVGSI